MTEDQRRAIESALDEARQSSNMRLAAIDEFAKAEMARRAGHTFEAREHYQAVADNRFADAPSGRRPASSSRRPTARPRRSPPAAVATAGPAEGGDRRSLAGRQVVRCENADVVKPVEPVTDVKPAAKPAAKVPPTA